MATAGDCYLKYGFPDAAMERQHFIYWDVPDDINAVIRTIPNKIYCNKDLVPLLLAAFGNIIDRGCYSEIKTWDGCFNVRPKRAYENIYNTLIKQGKREEAIKFLSIHAWGMAIDINASGNGLGKEPTLSQLLVRCFTDAGFIWGGNFKRKDGMHFEAEHIL